MNLPALRVALDVLDLWLVAHAVAAEVKRAHIARAWNRDPAHRDERNAYERRYRARHRDKVRAYPSRVRAQARAAAHT